MTDANQTAIPDAMRRPVDWSKSHIGREVWLAWNRLDSAIAGLGSADIRDVREHWDRVDKARDRMLEAMAHRDALS